MEQVIYGDILFFINFSMDTLSLFIAGKIMHLRTTVPAVSAASALGALYATAILFFYIPVPIKALLHAATAVIMCAVSFGGSVKKLLGSTCIFVAVNLFLGGGISSLYYAVAKGSSHRVYINGSAGTLYSGIPPGIIVACAALIGIFCIICGRIFTSKRASAPVTVEIWGCGQKIKFDSLCDTGNLLRDPYNGRPVIITGYMTVLPILPFDTKELFRTGDPSVLDRVDRSISHRVHLIPASGVAGDGLLLVYTPDRIYVSGRRCEACLGILPTQKDNNFGGYPAITPSVLC